LSYRQGGRHCGHGDEGDALGAHLLKATVEDVLFQLEIGNAVAKQAANAVALS